MVKWWRTLQFETGNGYDGYVKERDIIKCIEAFGENDARIGEKRVFDTKWFKKKSSQRHQGSFIDASNQ